jgi:hypothetical protein
MALIFMVVAIRRLKAALWERIAGCGNLIDFFSVLFLVCWLGQISLCLIEPGVGVLGFNVMPLLWRYSGGLCSLCSMFSFCQLVGALFLHVV